MHLKEYSEVSLCFKGSMPTVIDCLGMSYNPLSANPTKWSNTLKQLATNCLSVFNHFVKLALNNR